MLTVRANTTHDIEFSYITEVVFQQFLGVSAVFEKATDLSLDYYSIYYKDKEILSLPNKLLNSKVELLQLDNEVILTEVFIENLDKEKYNLISAQLPILFGDNESNSNAKDYLNIDVLGSAFYCISGLNEILCTQPLDRHERYDYNNSILFKLGIHERPIINEYVEILWKCLKSNCAQLNRIERVYEVRLSHDVDHPLISNFGIKVMLKELVKDVVLRKSPTLFIRRLGSLLSFGDLKRKLDPNNNIQYIMNQSVALGLVSRFNFITIHGGGGINGAYNLDTPFFHNMLKDIHAQGHVIGFHPSYDTYKDFQLFSKEYDILRDLAEKLNISQVEWGGRHHYLRFETPSTWRLWNRMNLDYDSSLGFNLIHGFRTGVCYPYTVFDVLNREKLDLIEYPLIFMDVNRPYSNNQSQLESAKALSDTVKKYKGVFTFLYHNNNIISEKEKAKYRQLLQIIKN